MDGYRKLSLLAALAFALAVVPTLTWLQFSGGGENLLVATVVEMHASDDAPWMIPTLNGQPRIRKPPLPAWVSAALMPQAMFETLSAGPPGSTRDAAYERLALALRIPAVVLACVMILLIYETGRTLGGAELGLAAAVVAASSLILLRQGRSITSDVHLATYVTLANLAMLKVLLGAPWLRWSLIAGAAMGLAILSKGPVALVQCALPIALCAIFLWRRGTPAAERPAAPFVPVASVAGLSCIAVALPWFAYVAATVPDVASIWFAEVTRHGATNLEPDPFYNYLSIFPLLAPWTVMLGCGLILCARRGRRDLSGLWPIVGLVAPLVIMSLAKDKSERYLLPMLAPAAVAAAHAVIAIVRSTTVHVTLWRMAWWMHWGLLLAICVGVPSAGAIGDVLPARQAWWTPRFAAVAAAVLVIAWAAALLVSIRRRTRIAPATMLVMFAVHGVFLHGYRDSPPGRSELKPIADAILAARPSADVWFYDPSPVPKSPPQDLQIYLNRVVRQAGTPDQLPAGDVVIVSLQRGDGPVPVPPGWQSFANVQVPGRQRFWHASSALYNLQE